MVPTLCFHCRGPGSAPWLLQGLAIPYRQCGWECSTVKPRYRGVRKRGESRAAGRRVKRVRSALLVGCLPPHRATPQNLSSFLPATCVLSTAKAPQQACYRPTLPLLPVLSLVPKGQVTSWTTGKNLKLPQSLVSCL